MKTVCAIFFICSFTKVGMTHSDECNA